VSWKSQSQGHCKSNSFHWLLFISPLWRFTEYSKPGVKKKVLFMHKVFSQSKDLENLYWLHRSSLLVYHTILERHISVIIYDHAICQCHNNVLFYISKILCSWCHLRGRTGKSFHCLHTLHQYWHFHLIKVWKCEKKKKKTKQTKKLNISMWLQLLYLTSNDHIAYTVLLYLIYWVYSLSEELF